MAPAAKPKARPRPAGKRVDAEQVRTVELISQIRSGTINGDSLDPESRQQVVATMAADGLTSSEIAQLLKVADRTIERDRKALRERNALVKDPRFTEQVLGNLMAEASLAIQRIRRVARDKDVPPAVRVDAEHRCYQIADSLVERLQKSGLVPTVAQKVEATVSHTADLPGLDELKTQLDQLRAISGADAEHVRQLEGLLAKAELATALTEPTLPEVVSDLEPAEPTGTNTVRRRSPRVS